MAAVLWETTKTVVSFNSFMAALSFASVTKSSAEELSSNIRISGFLTRALAMQETPQDKGKHLRIYYMTQVSVKPPTFVIFVNDKNLTHFSYTRYIENNLRNTFGFRGTSLRFIYREREDSIRG